MSIRYTIRADGDLLRVVASGRDHDLDEVMAYGAAVLDAVISAGCHRVLCDERAMEYAIGTVDTYELAKYTAEHARGVAKVAIVCRRGQEEDAEFWEDVAVNRGLQVKVFQRIEDAERWLGIGEG